MKKNVKGITLVSMVITIIVMLILAGVSISMVTGDNGVVTRASEGSVKTQLSSVESDIGLSISSNQTDYFAKFAESTTAAGSKTQYLTVENLNSYCSTVKFLYTTQTLGDTGITVSSKTSNGQTEVWGAATALTTGINTRNGSANLPDGSTKGLLTDKGSSIVSTGTSGNKISTTSGYANYALYFSDGSSGSSIGTNLYIVAVHFENGFFVIDDVGVAKATPASAKTLYQGALITENLVKSYTNDLGVEWLKEAKLY